MALGRQTRRDHTYAMNNLPPRSGSCLHSIILTHVFPATSQRTKGSAPRSELYYGQGITASGFDAAAEIYDITSRPRRTIVSGA